eukprot:TRINITY_DN5675_c0_g2_i1.p1 TRINITY_DN5675_c0_g2~~TRINITY_DN5675_c0_g2_i1.p1  ORF type:complete len:136 (+),score=2.65 TRINITY_DN5675_c0_g2_i1:167-574(+)
MTDLSDRTMLFPDQATMIEALTLTQNMHCSLLTNDAECCRPFFFPDLLVLCRRPRGVSSGAMADRQRVRFDDDVETIHVRPHGTWQTMCTEDGTFLIMLMRRLLGQERHPNPERLPDEGEFYRLLRRVRRNLDGN